MKKILHIACRNRNEKMINVLLQNGASPNIPDRAGKTPFHLACELNLPREIIEYMIRCDANHQVFDNLGNNPLDFLENTDKNGYLEYINRFHRDNRDLNKYLGDLGNPIKYHFRKRVPVFIKNGSKRVVEADPVTAVPELIFLACQAFDLTKFTDSMMLIEQVEQGKCKKKNIFF